MSSRSFFCSIPYLLCAGIRDLGARGLFWSVVVGATALAASPQIGTVPTIDLVPESQRVEHRMLIQTLELAIGLYIVIDTQDNMLYLRDQDRVLHRAACATGSRRKLEGLKRRHRWEFSTPTGRFSILRKVADPIWIKPEWHFIENAEPIPIFAEDRRRFQRGVLGSYALYFLQDFMIHGTLYEVNLGKSITHGCIRVAAADLRHLYEVVPTGCPVFIY